MIPMRSTAGKPSQTPFMTVILTFEDVSGKTGDREAHE
jgi:hypothetical protein